MNVYWYEIIIDLDSVLLLKKNYIHWNALKNVIAN